MDEIPIESQYAGGIAFQMEREIYALFVSDICRYLGRINMGIVRKDRDGMNGLKLEIIEVIDNFVRKHNE